MASLGHPGEKWLVKLQAVEKSTDTEAQEVAVLLKDFDARTDTWTVEPEGQDKPVALAAENLIRRLG